MNEWVSLLGGGVLLSFGAEWFVGGASALARSLRVPQILVGLTVVAYGTSAPEIIVGVQAARAPGMETSRSATSSARTSSTSASSSASRR